MVSLAKKPSDAHEPEKDEDDDDDLDNDEDGDDDEDDEGDPDDEDDDDGELTPERVARDLARVISDGYESCANAVEEKGRVLLDLEDDSRWTISVKRRD